MFLQIQSPFYESKPNVFILSLFIHFYLETYFEIYLQEQLKANKVRKKIKSEIIPNFIKRLFASCFYLRILTIIT